LSAPASNASPAHPGRKRLAIAAGIIAAIALIIWLVYYLLVGQYYIETDDAYIAADTSMIAAQVSGYVTKVAVRQNQPVKAGDLLVSIDPRDDQAALAGAQADMEAAQAAITSDQAQLSLQQAKIAGAQAAVMGDQARVAFAVQNQRRYAKLSGTGASPKQTADQATTDLATARAQLAADQAALLGANRTVDVLNAAAAQAQANLDQAKARAQAAALNLSHTDIRAPFDGVVGNKTVALGDYLQPGTQIMGIVPLDQVYVTANYKETQITNMQPGQKVSVVVDGYPALKVTGIVGSISPASGQEFALLPPDNATGNFTKIVQRVPVKILLNLNHNLIGKLRPGMSVEPDIDTRRSH
jgi:membrane fusion protein (multidrug efflux system)